MRPIAYLTPGATRPVAVADLCAMRRASTTPHLSPACGRPSFATTAWSVSRRTTTSLDYLITPELGGSDDRRNLWPERYSSDLWNARVEGRIPSSCCRMLVCAGTLPLETAQRDMATDWIAAYKKYFNTDRPLHAYSPFALRDNDGTALDVIPDLTLSSCQHPETTTSNANHNRERSSGGPAGVERRFRIRGDLQVGAVVVVVAAVLVVPVLRHELHDLQRALPAADVGQLDVSFEGIGRLGGMDEQAVGQHRRLRRRNRGGHRPRPALRLARHHIGMGGKLGRELAAREIR